MNKQNIILDNQDLLRSYKTTIPTKKLSILKSRKWLPLFPESDLAETSAYITGKIMGDGNLDNSFTCRFVGTYNDLKKLKKIIVITYLIDAKSIKLYKREARGTSWLLQVNDSLFGRFFYSLGAPKGNKTKTEFLVPTWITKSEKCTKYFLQGIFEDELSTIKLKRNRFLQEATFRMVKTEEYQQNLREFLNQIRSLTEKFSVKCSNMSKSHFENVQKDGNKTYSLCFRILGNLNNMVLFKKNIGFKLNKTKIKELDNAIMNVKRMRGQGLSH
ncbi:hypothetical protein ACFL0W_03180 [Nanoarchaeota archaeon]